MSLFVPAKIGYTALIGIIGGQSIGLPLPGGTAMIGAGVLAAQGKLNIVLICALSIIATIVGSNIGYFLGRRLGTHILSAPGPLARRRHRLLTLGHPLMERYGSVVVLFARSAPAVREGAPLIVGTLEMNWYKFALWNAIGGVAWVLEHSLLGYYFGRDAKHAAIIPAIVVLKLLVVGGIVALIARRKRSNAVSKDNSNPLGQV